MPILKRDRFLESTGAAEDVGGTGFFLHFQQKYHQYNNCSYEAENWGMLGRHTKVNHRADQSTGYLVANIRGIAKLHFFPHSFLRLYTTYHRNKTLFLGPTTGGPPHYGDFCPPKIERTRQDIFDSGFGFHRPVRQNFL